MPQEDLTEYQNMIFAMLLSDMSMREIADHMGRYTWILARTNRRVYAKMGVKSRNQLKAKFANMDQETTQQELRELISRQLDEPDVD